MASASEATLGRLMKQEQESRSSEDCTPRVKRRALHCCQKESLHNPVWRQMVVEWCYQVIDHISADRELVYIAMNILDRFLTRQHANKTNKEASKSTTTRCYQTDKKAYETAVMTALLMTMKLQGLSTLCVNDLVKMSSNSVTAKDIVDVGKEIIQSLTWNKQIPTAARFAHALVELLPGDINERIKISIFESAVFQIELSIQDEFCSSQPPSLIAWMAFENAINDNTRLDRHDKAMVSSKISRLMDHHYSTSLRRRLQGFQMQSHVSSKMPVVIPPDDDEHVQQPKEGVVLNLKSRPLTESHVISLDDMKNIPSMKEYVQKREIQKDFSSLRRSKRIRFC